ncbi:hypothetical protein F511_06971 [Dorcoceras hygrometricum]|uniref:Dystroglycan-like n=1 Tax=Dorcoceras hygrometricum TaxID=472368 RepID=A0A2Z7B882_9LAMI|nr:hypothetical protein F511_06971 [Dorcoceras hygrometricum]
MASSLFSNAQHVDFDSVLAMDDPGMVSMFEALEASGLRGFLGCPAIVYEDALVDFFENASVRNGVVFSTVGGQIVKISEKLFAESFELPVEGLEELSEMPKDAIFDARSIVSMTGEKINLSGRKNQMKMPYRLLCDIVAKAISVKAGSFNAITVEKFSYDTLPTMSVFFKLLRKRWSDVCLEVVDFSSKLSLLPLGSVQFCSSAQLAAPVFSSIPSRSTVFELRVSQFCSVFVDMSFFNRISRAEISEFLSAIALERTVLRGVQSFEDSFSVAPRVQLALEQQQIWVRPLRFPAVDLGEASAFPASKLLSEEIVVPFSAEEELSEDEKTSLDDILLSIPVDIPLPSTCMEVTQIKMGQMIKIPGVTKWTWFLKHLPRIPADDKGKEILVEKDPVRGNPAKEHFSLICADIDLLVSLRAKFIDEVAALFNSFSLRKFSSINFDEMYSKEDQVLRWGETESPQEAIQRKFYILLKYRTVLVWKFLDAWRINFAPGQGSTAVDIQVIELLSALHLSLLEELAKEARCLGLNWTKPCCSSVVEGSPRDRGAVLARSNSTTRSLCWIRRMFMVDGVWKVEQCADMWVKIPKKVESTEIPRQRQYDDTLPTMSVFFKLLRKRWSDVCLEVVDFSAKMRLLPLGSVQFCSSAQLAAPVFSSIPSRPTVFELRFSQFCSVFVDMSLFNRISRADISEFLSAIALEKTVLRGVQSFEDSFSVAPRAQLALEQQYSSSSSSSSSLHFDKTDIDATASSQPHISQDLSALFADFQANLSEQLFDSQSNISSKLHKIEQTVRDSLIDQAAMFKSLSQEARQETRTLNDVQTIRFNEFRKKVLEQNASIFVGLADVRKEVDTINAKVDIMASRLNDIQKEAEATKEAHSHQLLEFQSQAQENHTVIHALEQNASIFIGLADVRKEVDAINAKVDIMASRLNDIQKEAEATKEAHSHQLLEFQSQAQENHTVIHAQLSELVDYIHRGRADKKGEMSGSRGPQQPAGTQITGSAVTPTFEQRVQIAQRRLVQTVINADAATRESQEAAERDRERRRKEAQSLKRRRRD